MLPLGGEQNEAISGKAEKWTTPLFPISETEGSAWWSLEVPVQRG